MLDVTLALPAVFGVAAPPRVELVVMLTKVVDRAPGAPLNRKFVVSVNGVIWLVTTVGDAAV